MSASVIADLKSLRRALVAERAQIAANGASFQNDERSGNWKPTDGSNFGNDLKIVQDQIEAVDRAILDETRVSPEADPEEAESFFDKRTRGRTDIA